MDIELISSRVINDECIQFVAIVPDMVECFPATYFDPAEYRPAQCRGVFYWNVDDDGPLPALTDEDLERLCQDASIEWEVDYADDYDF